MNAITQNLHQPRWTGHSLKISRHAIRRAKERLRWSIEAITRMADRALEQGLAPNDCTGALKFALISKSSPENLSCPFLYGEYIYFFRYALESNEVWLVTIYRAPHELLRVLRNKKPHYGTATQFGSN